MHLIIFTLALKLEISEFLVKLLVSKYYSLRVNLETQSGH